MRLTCCCEYGIVVEKLQNVSFAFVGDFTKHPAYKESQKSRHGERETERGLDGVGLCLWKIELKGNKWGG